jgi:rare lipoprotein A (peptidoglycan hydrolase)
MRLTRHIRTNTTTITTTLAVAATMLAAMLVHADAAQARQQVWSPLQGRYANVIKPRHLGQQVATWYGPGLWGHRTGCGTTLRRRTWGVAHRTLPCGKLVWVRFRGRSIAVPVVDRGPYSGASWDLTERTARYLRFKRHGHARVRVDVMRRTIPRRRL